MREPDRRATLGKQGESLACAALRRRGYAIVATRYRTRRGEIDIVARDGATLVFVEVKTRAGTSRGTPAEAVTAAKRRRLARLSAHYLAGHPADTAARFDVVCISTSGDRPPQIDIIPHAFTLDDV